MIPPDTAGESRLPGSGARRYLCLRRDSGPLSPTDYRSVIKLILGADTHARRNEQRQGCQDMIRKTIALSLLAGAALCATAQAGDIDHVLLISVDGLHALDVARYVESHPNSALAEVAAHGVTFRHAPTPAN